jgi:hypothetical protein
VLACLWLSVGYNLKTVRELSEDAWRRYGLCNVSTASALLYMKSIFGPGTAQGHLHMAEASCFKSLDIDAGT